MGAAHCGGAGGEGGFGVIRYILGLVMMGFWTLGFLSMTGGPASQNEVLGAFALFLLVFLPGMILAYSGKKASDLRRFMMADAFSAVRDGRKIDHLAIASKYGRDEEFVRRLIALAERDGVLSPDSLAR